MTPEQIKKDIEKTLKELKDYGKTITFDASGKSLKELQDNLKVFQAGLKETKRAAEEIGDSFETTLESLINAQESVKDLSSVLKSALTPELKVAQKSVLKTLNIQKELNQGYGSEAEILRNIRKIKYSISNLDALNKTAGDDAVTATIQNLNYTQDVANKQLEIVQSSEAITKNISSFSNLLSEIPVIGKAISGPFKDIADEINKASKAEQSLTLSLKGYGDQLERLKELDRTKYSDEELKIIDNKIKELKKNITETKIELDTLPKPLSNISEKIKKISLQGLAIGILTKVFITLKSAIIEVDDQSTQLARSLSISKRQGLDLRDSFNDIAMDSKLTTKELVDAQLTFTKLTGAASILSTENLKALAEAKDLIGLSEDAQKGLMNMAFTTGQEFEDIENTILGTSKITMMQNGLMMDQKEILDEVLKTSYSLRIQFGNNVQEITRAVVEAKRLGFTLQDIEGVQSNLLNFESSIAAELEAELLTGKELNLEKARYFALTGDIRGLTQEINKNIGSSADFERMNVLQREAFAKSLGFSADKLAEILYTQEQNDAIAKSLNGQQAVANAFREAELDMNAKNLAHLIATGKIDKEVLNTLGDKERSQISQLTTQQEFNRAVENLKEVFIGMMNGPVGAFLDGFNSLFKTINSSPIAKFVTGSVMIAGLLGSTALIAASIAQLATKGTFFNPMFVKDIGVDGGGGMMASLKNSMKKGGMLRKIGTGALGAGVGMAGGSALGGGGTGAMIGSMIGTGIGAAGQLIGIPMPIGMALGGLAGGAIGGKFDEPETTMQVNDFTIETNPNDKIGGVLDNTSVDKINSTLEALLSETRNMVKETKGISNMRVQLETGVIAGHMTNGGTKTG
jgi:hypothetical protein